MDTTEKIRSAHIRTVKAFTKRPELAQMERRTSARITDGLTCEIKVGEWTLTADVAEAAGGNNLGPTPGELQEASLAGCIATGVAMKFAELGIAHNGLEVEVFARFDIRRAYGVESDAPVGYRELSYTVHVECGAAEADIMRALDDAEAANFTIDNLRRPLEITRRVSIRQTERTAKKS